MVSKKIVLIGDFSTGKTSLIRRFVDNAFSEDYLSTLGVTISRKNVEYMSGKTMRALIWDVEGGTPTQPMNETYLIGAHGAICVADITRRESIEHLKTYIEKVEKRSPKAAIVVALNKVDLTNREEAERLAFEAAERLGMDRRSIFRTSAKSGENVEAMFVTLARDTMGETK